MWSSPHPAEAGTHEVHRLRPDERQAAEATLAEAFRSDPMIQILEPDERKRDAVAVWFFERIVAYALRWAEVWATDGASSIAVWVPPGVGGMTTPRMLRVGLAALPLKVGIRGTMRFLAAVGELERLHEAVSGPHWYLPAIGTRAASAGRGEGSALLEVGARGADAAGVRCYLEATTPANVAFYERRGFEITERRRVGEFTFTGMIRPPSLTRVPPAGRLRSG